MAANTVVFRSLLRSLFVFVTRFRSSAIFAIRSRVEPLTENMLELDEAGFAVATPSISRVVSNPALLLKVMRGTFLSGMWLRWFD